MSDHDKERLSAFADGELPPVERAVVEAHVQACAECARHLEILRAVDTAAAALPVSAPAGYFEALPTRVRARLETTRRPRVLRPPAWTWAVAAALLLAVVTPLTLRRARPSASEPYPTPAVAAPPVMVERAAPTAPPAKDAPAIPAFDGRTGSKDDAESKPQRPTDRIESSRLEGGALAKDEAGAAPAEMTAPARLRQAGPGGPNAPAQSPLQTQAAPAFAPAPASAAAAAEEATAAAELREDAQEESPAPRPKAAGGMASSRHLREEDLEARPLLSPEERAFQRLTAIVPRTLPALRERREAWRSYSLAFASSPRADEARVRVIETGVEAWRVGADPADGARARADAAAYLVRPDAAQARRVRALLAVMPAGGP